MATMIPLSSFPCVSHSSILLSLAYQDDTSSPPPLYPHRVPEWGTTEERMGISPADFGLPPPPRWLGTNELMPPVRRQAMRILLDAE